MDRQTALDRMIAPGTPRAGKYRSGVIQVHLTRACDKSCYGCTQGSNLAGKPTFMTPGQFEAACASLAGWWGVVGVFGGNPATSPHFEECCAILRRHFPREQCGVWCNNPISEGKAAAMRLTFEPRVSNLNVHLDAAAHADFKRWWPESMPFGLDKDSRHSPPFVAMRDVVADERLRWELISNCDINQHWSAMLCAVRGQLRAYFCEVAGAQAMLHADDPDWPDLGAEASPGWWRRPMQDFAAQVDHYCHRCSVPLRGHGELAQAADDRGVEQTSATHAGVYRPKRPGRFVQVVTDLVKLEIGRIQRSTDYMGNVNR